MCSKNKKKWTRNRHSMRRMMEMDEDWYEEQPTLNRVIWRGAITQTNLPLIEKKLVRKKEESDERSFNMTRHNERRCVDGVLYFIHGSATFTN